MAKVSYPDPFEMAKRLIMAYPTDDPWEVKKYATAQEFLQAVDGFLAGNISEEALLDEQYAKHIGMVQNDNAPDGNIFLLHHRPVNKNSLKQWRDSFAQLLSDYGSPLLNSPPFKKALLPYAIDERYTSLAAMLADQAISAALKDKASVRHLEDIPPVSISVHEDEVTYNNNSGNDIPDFRNRAVAQLPELRKKLAELFEEKTDGFFLLPDDKRLDQFPGLVPMLGDFLNKSKPHRDKGMLIKNIYNMHGGNNMAYYLDGEKTELNASDMNKIHVYEAISNIYKDEVKDEMLEPYKQKWGMEKFERIEIFVKARAEDRLQEYYEITEPAQVSWIKRYVMQDHELTPPPA